MIDMFSEIIEAIEEYYKDDEILIAECMLYLAGAKWKGYSPFCEWLNNHGRCWHCGAKLTQRAYKEPHPEVGEGVYETLYENYCPICERGVD